MSLSVWAGNRGSAEGGLSNYPNNRRGISVARRRLSTDRYSSDHKIPSNSVSISLSIHRGSSTRSSAGLISVDND